MSVVFDFSILHSLVVVMVVVDVFALVCRGLVKRDNWI